MILAGDIGGTNTRLALFDQGKKKVEKKYSSHSYSGLEQIAEEFLRDEKQTVEKACFGIAGPVRNGKCKATNIPWTVDINILIKTLNIPTIRLLNDLEANAYGVKVLKKEELFLLQAGSEESQGNQALIAAGTGLGEAGMFWDGKEHHPFACEGGHTDFAPRNEEEFALLLYLQKKIGHHVSYERIVSGPGLHSIFQFLIETRRASFSPKIKEEMEKRPPSIVISDWGNKKKDVACSLALNLFVSLYGAEAGNVALKFMSLGGLYIGGGIAPHILDSLQQGPFLASFLDKGRFKGLLASMPVWVVLNEDAALLGAAACAEKL